MSINKKPQCLTCRKFQELAYAVQYVVARYLDDAASGDYCSTHLSLESFPGVTQGKLHICRTQVGFQFQRDNLVPCFCLICVLAACTTSSIDIHIPQLFIRCWLADQALAA